MSAIVAAPAVHRVLHHRLLVTVGGVPTVALAADAQHGVNQGKGTASFDVPLPLPDHLRGDDGNVLNAPVEIQAGHDETAIRTRFSGFIRDDRGTITDGGATLTISASGWSSILDYSEPTDLVWRGPISLRDIFLAMCRRRRIPKYRADMVTAPDGTTPILMGGNLDIDDGLVRIPKRTSPLQWLSREARLYGYRVFDTPDGTVVLQRVSGAPVGAAAASYIEGVHPHAMERTRTLADMVTYAELKGARYTDTDGVSREVRSIPDTVPFNPLLDPPGYRHRPFSDAALVSQQMADIARNVIEIDYGAPTRTETWEVPGDSWRQPGEVVNVSFPTLDTAGARWLMSLREVIDDAGYTATMTGWSGGGVALPAGDDAVEVPVPGGPWHVGDEYIPWYAVPQPQGTTIPIPITVPDEYTSIAISGWVHGSNSYFIDGVNTDSTVSRLEVWQGGDDKPVGTADLPVMPENYEQRLEYGDGLKHWLPFRMSVPAPRGPGAAEIRAVAGEERRATGGPVDDFEMQGLVVTYYGAGQPDLPEVR